MVPSHWAGGQSRALRAVERRRTLLFRFLHGTHALEMQRRFLLASSSSPFFFPRRPFLGGRAAATLSDACGAFASPASIVGDRPWGVGWRGVMAVSEPSVAQRSINQQRASAVCRAVCRGSALGELSTWRDSGPERDGHLTHAGTSRECCGSERLSAAT